MAGARRSGLYGKGEGIERDKRGNCERGPQDTERGFTRVDNVTYANTNERDVVIQEKMHKMLSEGYFVSNNCDNPAMFLF